MIDSMGIEGGSIVINGEEVPKIIKHADGTETWNLDAETAAAIDRAVSAQILRAVLAVLAAGADDSEFDD
ncbi:hypothetical protein [Kitasatospora sp. NPDC056800]|uniref:hypothetical protein n=1 Tax=Kitasatospora sp. NPDC056800 TaxID=3345948 RepID=UPI00367A108F